MKMTPAQRTPRPTEMAAGDAGGIAVEAVTRTFGAVRAVDGLTLSARPGEVTALVGPNGSGKTTLLLMLATLLAPDSGTIRVGGHDPVADPVRVRRIMGWMPDGFGTWDALTVREVLATVAAAYRMAPAAARPRIDELIAMLHLEDLADQPARVLSRGQKQRLGLARALIHSPSVLLLDEPASGLDPRSRIELRDVVRRLAAAGATVLISSHILSELEEMSDRAYVIAGGRTVAVHDLHGGDVGRWRITALDRERLHAALQAGGISAVTLVVPDDIGTSRATVEVEAADEAQAAAVLAQLVAAGAPVVGFGPSAGDLESAYLAATEDRR